MQIGLNIYANDDVFIPVCQPPWASGTMSWIIPNAWIPPVAVSFLQPETEFVTTTEDFTISQDGTVSISKYGHTAMRTTNDFIFVDGVRIR